MRRLAPALLVGLLLVGGCSSSTDDGVVPPPGDPTIAVDTPELVALRARTDLEPCVPGTASTALAAVTLPCLGGGPDVDLSTLAGPMVVNLWNAGCGVCRVEMPVLQSFHETYGAQVPVLGIDLQDTVPGIGLEQLADRGVTYPQLADPGGDLLTQVDFARARSGLPFTVVVDADGVVQTQRPGAFRSLDELVDVVDDALGTDLAAGPAPGPAAPATPSTPAAGGGG